MGKQFKTMVGEIEAVYVTKNMPKVKVTCSGDMEAQGRIIFKRGTLELREEMKVVFLNRANNTLGWAQVSIGGVAGTFSDPKTIFSMALIANASSIIMMHNHPSGNVKPSQQDDILTKRIAECGKFLGMPLLDHVILTKDNYYSYADECKL